MKKHKKKKGITRIRALEIRLHNLEVALVAIAGLIEQGNGEHVDGPARALFEASEALGGFQFPEMIKVTRDE